MILFSLMKKIIKKTAVIIYPFIKYIEKKLKAIYLLEQDSNYCLTVKTSINEIRCSSLEYLKSLQVIKGKKFVGYRHSVNTKKPVLYATLAALLLKHLYGAKDDMTAEAIELVLAHQSADGLFRDPVIDCREAETEDWWGWRHLTLHALMTLALYGVQAKNEISYLNKFQDEAFFRKYLNSRNWAERAAWTSNELQNIGVMYQYARDYQGSQDAETRLEIMYEEINAHQDPVTGLHGHRFDSPEELSMGVQAGYHFWLLFFFDKRPIQYTERIIDSLLKTQNRLGGFGVKWNSSACEDIDSIDPLVRFSRLTDYRFDDIQSTLQRALPAILHNLNFDGGWVFSRHEPLKIVHSQMYSEKNKSNLFYTWFRTLGLAYCLEGLKHVPDELQYNWNFGWAPGHQFFRR